MAHFPGQQEEESPPWLSDLGLKANVVRRREPPELLLHPQIINNKGHPHTPHKDDLVLALLCPQFASSKDHCRTSGIWHGTYFKYPRGRLFIVLIIWEGAMVCPQVIWAHSMFEFTLHGCHISSSNNICRLSECITLPLRYSTPQALQQQFFSEWKNRGSEMKNYGIHWSYRRLESLRESLMSQWCLCFYCFLNHRDCPVHGKSDVMQDEG